jgi:hypothetical protein
MIHKDTKIHVVLHKNERKAASVKNYEGVCERYAQFFSTRIRDEDLTFEPDGVGAFVGQVTGRMSGA